MRILSILACLALLATPLAAKGTNKVLLIAKENANSLLITKEVKPMIRMLGDAGFKVIIASATGAPIGSGEASVKPALKLSAVAVPDYAGVVIPCMEPGFTQELTHPSPVALQIVKKAAARKLPIAAQDESVTILGLAGLLKGKGYAFDGENLGFGGTYKGVGVVTDGTIITSGMCPSGSAKHGTAELMTRFIEMLKAVH